MSDPHRDDDETECPYCFFPRHELRGPGPPERRAWEWRMMPAYPICHDCGNAITDQSNCKEATRTGIGGGRIETYVHADCRKEAQT